MIIGIDGRVFQECEPTGVTRYAHFFITELARKYPEVKFVLFIAGIKPFVAPDFSSELVPRISWQRLKIPHLVLNISFFLLRWPKLDLWLAGKLKTGIDLLVLPNLHFVAVSSRVKVLHVVHDLSFFHEPRWYGLKSRFWHWAVLLQRLWWHADLLVAVSKITALDFCRTTGVSVNKVSVLPWPVEKFTNCHPGGLKADRIHVDAIAPLQHDKNEGSHVIKALAIGRVDSRKNIQGLIEGLWQWLQQKHIDLTIVGPGVKPQQNNNISFTGFISEEARKRIIQESNLFFEVSFFEGIGIPLVESRGLAQVSSNTTSLPEYASSQAILINPYDLAEYPQAVETSLCRKGKNMVE